MDKGKITGNRGVSKGRLLSLHNVALQQFCPLTILLMLHDTEKKPRRFSPSSLMNTINYVNYYK